MLPVALTNAVTKIDRYLNDSTYDDVYSGSMRERIIKLRNEMDQLRAELETPPAETPSEK